jgi:hypothetical protein
MRLVISAVVSIALSVSVLAGAALARAEDSEGTCSVVSRELMVATGAAADISNALTYKPSGWKVQLKRGRDNARASSAAILQASKNPQVIAQVRKFAREASKKRPVTISMMRPLSDMQDLVKQGKC